MNYIIAETYTVEQVQAALEAISPGSTLIVKKLLKLFCRPQKQTVIIVIDTLRANFVDLYTVPGIEGAQQAAKKQVVDLEKANADNVEIIQKLVTVRIINSALFYFYFSNTTDAIFHKG